MGGATAPVVTDVRRGPATVVVAFRDELDLATVPDLEQRVDRALARGPATVLVDLSGCAFADLYACRALARLTARAAERGADVRLRGLSPRLRAIVTRTAQDGLRIDG